MGISKKGQSMSIGTLVIIVLSIVVLVFLIYGFTVGWGNFFGNIQSIGGGKENVQSIVTACDIACSTNSEFDYKTRVRELKYMVNGKLQKASVTCEKLENPLAESPEGCFIEGEIVSGPPTPTENNCNGVWRERVVGTSSAFITNGCDSF